MAKESAETDKRLDDLNLRVESIDRRMETGFAEMREEFRAVRAEMQNGLQAVRGEMQGGLQAVRDEMQGGLQAVRDEMQSELQAVRADMGGMQRTLIQAMLAGFTVTLVGFAGTIATILATA